MEAVIADSKYLGSCQTGFTSRYGITRVAFKILATATASQIYHGSKVNIIIHETKVPRKSYTSRICKLTNIITENYIPPFSVGSILHPKTPVCTLETSYAMLQMHAIEKCLEHEEFKLLRIPFIKQRQDTKIWCNSHIECLDYQRRLPIPD